MLNTIWVLLLLFAIAPTQSHKTQATYGQHVLDHGQKMDLG